MDGQTRNICEECVGRQEVGYWGSVWSDQECYVYNYDSQTGTDPLVLSELLVIILNNHKMTTENV